MSLALALSAVAFFSILAFWKDKNAVLFMLTGGSAMMLGLYWFDYYTTDVGLGISLMIILYSFVCMGFAFRCIFWFPKRDEE